MMVPVTKEVFNAFLNIAMPHALPDGFQPAAGYIQTHWVVDGKNVARRSDDGVETIYEVDDQTLKLLEERE